MQQFVAELGQGVQGLDHRAFEVFIDFGGGVVVAVDVAAVVGSAQQFHVVAAGERAHVVDLRHARQEELHGAGGQVVLVVAAEGRVVRGVDLIEVEVAGGGTGGGLGFAVGVGMDGVDQVVDVLVGHEALEGAVELVGADVDHADASCVSSTVTALFGRISVQWATGST